jgi:hypothetical protein
MLISPMCKRSSSLERISNSRFFGQVTVRVGGHLCFYVGHGQPQGLSQLNSLRVEIRNFSELERDCA